MAMSTSNQTSRVGQSTRPAINYLTGSVLSTFGMRTTRKLVYNFPVQIEQQNTLPDMIYQIISYINMI